MPAGPARYVRASALKMGEDWVGASVEVNNNKVYDPLGMLKLHDLNPEVFPHPKWLRESELKHCRAAMLASVGAFTAQYGLAIPGYTPVADPVENLNHYVTEFPLGFSQIILAIGIIEGHFNPSAFWTGKGERAAGDFGYDPLGMSKGKNDAVKAKFQLQELKNGRLAMIAMAAYTSEHWLPGSVPFLPGNSSSCNNQTLFFTFAFIFFNYTTSQPQTHHHVKHTNTLKQQASSKCALEEPSLKKYKPSNNIMLRGP